MKKVKIFAIATVFALFAMALAINTSACGVQGSNMKVGATCNGGASYSKADKKQAEDTKMAESKVQLVTFSVSGMTCGGCENQVKTALKNQPGIIEIVTVSHQSNQAILKYDPQKIETKTIAAVITSAGFKSEILTTVGTEVSGNKQDSKIKDI